MSRQRTEASQLAPVGLHDAHMDLSTMILREGRSWSGHERHCCYLNTGQGAFADVSAISGYDFPDDGRGIATHDWDGDGDLDLWVSNRNGPRLRLLRNEASKQNQFLQVRLQGNGRTTARDAIGARVEVRLAGATKPLFKTLRAGEGFLAQSSKLLHFGLGEARQVEQLRVRWPDGAVEDFGACEANRLYRLFQGAGKPAVAQVPRLSTALAAGSPEPLPKSEIARIPLVTTLSAPRLSYMGFDGEQRNIATGQGEAVLLNLWASWCRPCLAELKAFATQHEQLADAGIRVVALSVDSLEGKQKPQQDAVQFVEQNGLPFATGYATPQLAKLLQEMHDLLLKGRRPLPVPTSFLIDRRGRLAFIYKGPLEVEQLLADADWWPQSRLERFSHAARVPGAVIQDEQIETVMRTADLNVRLLYANGLYGYGLYEDAVRQYKNILDIDDTIAEVFFNRGLVYQRLDRTDEAIDDFQQALALRTDYAEALTSRGTLYQQQGQFEEAFADYSRAIELNSELPQSYTNRGMLHQMAGRLEPALEDFERALQLDPQQTEARFFRGIVLQALGQDREARENFTDVIEADPTRADALLARAETNTALGDTAAALGDYARALQVQPNFAAAHHGRGKLHLAAGDTSLALNDFDQAIKHQPRQPDYWLSRAALRMASREHAEAVADYSEAIRLAPQLVNAYFGRARAQLNLQKFPQAIDDYTKVVELRPNAAEAYKQRALAHVHLGENALAIADFRRTTELVPSDAESLGNLAWLQATCPDDSLRNGAAAVRLARQACELTQWKQWVALDTLAAASAEVGDFDNALKWQAAAMKLAPAVAQAQLQARLDLYQSGKPYREERISASSPE